MPAITARQYGEEMRKQGIQWPAPAIGSEDILRPGIAIYRVGRRALDATVVLARQGWGTVYVSPSYRDYRGVFDAVMPRSSIGRDVDHLLPKSTVPDGDYIALGRISIASNRGWNDGTTHQAMAQKVRDMPTDKPHGFLSRLTDLERGWAAVTCYIRPLFEMDKGAMQLMTAAQLRTTFG